MIGRSFFFASPGEEMELAQFSPLIVNPEAYILINIGDHIPESSAKTDRHCVAFAVRPLSSNPSPTMLRPGSLNSRVKTYQSWGLIARMAARDIASIDASGSHFLGIST